jgi:hypothetical protein
VESFEGPDYYARVKCAELLGKFSGLIVRKEETKVEHSLDLYNIIEARRRMERLRDSEAQVIDVTAKADEKPS